MSDNPISCPCFDFDIFCHKSHLISFVVFQVSSVLISLLHPIKPNTFLSWIGARFEGTEDPEMVTPPPEPVSFDSQTTFQHLEELTLQMTVDWRIIMATCFWIWASSTYLLRTTSPSLFAFPGPRCCLIGLYVHHSCNKASPRYTLVSALIETI